MYFVFFILSLLASFIKKTNPNKLFGLVLLVAMCLMCALRSKDVGVDTPTYLIIYNSSNSIDHYKSEFLFFNIVKFFIQNNIDAKWCQFFITLITYSAYTWVFCKKSKNTCLSILIFIISINGYFFETFNIVRQSAATAFLLCSYVFLEEKKLIKSIVFILLATGFHASTLIYTPFIFLAYKFIPSNNFVYISISITLLFSFFASSISFISGIITYLSALGIGGTGKYEIYVNYRLELARNLNGLITLLFPLNVLCLYTYRLYKNNILIRIFLWGVIFLNIISVMPTSYRMAFGLTCVEILIYPIIIVNKSKYKWIPISIVVLLVIYWLYRYNFTIEAALLEPYDIFLDD